jgi:hypothetical protein
MSFKPRTHFQTPSQARAPGAMIATQAAPMTQFGSYHYARSTLAPFQGQAIARASAPPTYATNAPVRSAKTALLGSTNLVAQCVQFPTHDPNGFLAIEGVSIFDPNEELGVGKQLAFVVLQEGGPIYVATGQQGRHPALYETARIKEDLPKEKTPSVYYAGSIIGLREGGYAWTNDSGHFTPRSENADQAGLPMDRFIPYEEYKNEGTSRFNPVMAASEKPKVDLSKTMRIDIGNTAEDQQALLPENQQAGCWPCNIL